MHLFTEMLLGLLPIFWQPSIQYKHNSDNLIILLKFCSSQQNHDHFWLLLVLHAEHDFTHWVCVKQSSGVARAFPGGRIPIRRARLWKNMWNVWGKIGKNDRNLRIYEESGTLSHQGCRDCEAGYAPDAKMCVVQVTFWDAPLYVQRGRE